MKNKLLKFGAIALSALTMCGTAAACGSTPGGVDDKGNVTQIVMWCGGSEWSGQNYRNLQNFINDYNKVKPNGFKVNLVRKDDLEKAFQTSIAGGTQPDLMLWDRFNTATNVVNNYLYPIDDLIERDNFDVAAFHSATMKEMTYDGRVYGLPVDIDVWGTYVNMDFVAKYDAAHPGNGIADKLTAEWTWNDLLDVAKALNGIERGVAGYSSGDQEQHLFKYYVSTGHGEEFLVPDTASTKKGKYLTNFENEWTEKILEFFKEVKNANVGGNQEKDSFTSKLLAMANMPLYYNNSIKQSTKVTNYKFLPQPKPGGYGGLGDGVNGGMLGGYGLAFPKPKDKFVTKQWQAKHEAAWTFTKWLCADKDNMLKWSNDLGSLPALLEAVNDEACVQNNQVLADARTYVNAKVGDDYAYITRPQVPNYLTLQTDVINTQVSLCVGGSISVSECIKQLKNNGNSKLEMGLTNK